MTLEPKEAFKVGFALVGCAVLVYQAFATVTNNVPLKAVVNPQRWGVLAAGLGLVSLSYGWLAVMAGNNWAPADVWVLISPMLNELPTPPRVIAAVVFLLIGLLGFVGTAAFCIVVYPPDAKAFRPKMETGAAYRAAVEAALSSYTRRRGGIEYAAVLALPSVGALPTAEALIDYPPPCASTEHWLLQRIDTRDARQHSHLEGRTTPLDDTRRRQRIDWLALALETYRFNRELAPMSAVCDLGPIAQTRTKLFSGGMILHYLLPPEDGQENILIFGVTTTAAEVANGRLELHFDMLTEALAGVIRSRDVFKRK